MLVMSSQPSDLYRAADFTSCPASMARHGDLTLTRPAGLALDEPQDTVDPTSVA